MRSHGRPRRSAGELLRHGAGGIVFCLLAGVKRREDVFNILIGEAPVRSGKTSATSIVGSVIVPVLSTQSTSTCASVSMQFMSCTSTRLLVSFRQLTAMATLVRR